MRFRWWAVALLLWGCGGDGDGGSGSGSGSPYSVGLQPQIQVTPNPVSFAAVTIGGEERQTVVISNLATATGNLEITRMVLETGSQDLTVTDLTATLLAPGDSTQVEVVYAPSDSAPDSGYLAIYYTKSVEPFRVPINTTEQVGTLTVYPAPMYFSGVEGGTSKTIAARVSNLGSDSLQIGGVTFTFDSSVDFKVGRTFDPVDSQCAGIEVTSEKAYPFQLPPGGQFCVEVIYTPVGGGSDIGVLQILDRLDAGGGAVVQAQTDVSGNEIGPEINIVPTQELNFGAVALNDSSELEFKIVNEGSKDLIISAVVKGEKASDAFDDVEVVTEVPDGTVVAPGLNLLSVKVRFSPLQNYPVSYGPIGWITVASNDNDEPEAFVTVFGQVASPKLQVTPAEVVDFGLVALNKKGTRTFTLTNVGTVDLNVSALALGTNTADGEYAIDDDAGLPGVIPPGEARSLTLSFENKGGTEGEVVWGTIDFQTDDPNGATTVNLKATRTDSARCELMLNPGNLNFGVVPYGHERVMTVNVRNIGSSPCSYSHATVHEGASFFPGQPAQCTAGVVSTAKSWVIVSQPPAIKDLIKPGESYPLEIKFLPKGNIWSQISEELGDFEPFSGLVQVHVLDFAVDPQKGVEVVVPAGKPGEAAACNLQGKSGRANIAAIPGDVKFGLTTVGCHSQTHTITIYNTGKAPLQLCKIGLDSCTTEVKLKDVPPVPTCVDETTGGLMLTQGTPVEVKVVYAPQDTSKDGCALVVESGDADSPILTVPLSGQGTYDDEQTDTFTQLSGQKVDVLFVVDNSGSMGEEQSSLASNFSAFIAATSQWNTDYQIGVVSTDVGDDNPEAGIFHYENVRIVTPATKDEFKKNVKLGTNGSGTEEGLEAAYKALTFPLMAREDPIKTCTADADCTAPAVCIEVQGQKQCGGPNGGFLRDDATLEVVFVSDEEDQSPAVLSFYIDFFKSIKGFANEALFHAHAIVGDPGQGCSGGGGDASAGNRYYDVSQATGGKFHSICSSDWGKKLEDIGNVAFGLQVQFFLSRPAVPDSVTVKIDGALCGQGWAYQPDTNAVLFDEAGPCMPQENQKIEIHYDVICYSE